MNGSRSARSSSVHKGSIALSRCSGSMKKFGVDARRGS
jgi:hypothetical protein